MLKVKDLHAYYGSIEALRGIDLEVSDKSIVCLIGSNGAGKTTLLKSISGMVQHTGRIEWDSENIRNYSSVQIARRGFFGKKRDDQELEYVFNMFPRLGERRNQLSWSLSGGEQQMLAIGRALMGRPKILLLDEPSMGLAPLVIEELFEKIVEINNQGMPILMVEQNARIALEVSDYAYVISQGRIELSGPAKELIHDDRVINAYFGTGAGSKPA